MITTAACLAILILLYVAGGPPRTINSELIVASPIARDDGPNTGNNTTKKYLTTGEAHARRSIQRVH
ncbi:hypothetical protein SEA_BACONJACK_62 [Mycobacterium phage BaconJack]|nr:hypothetical protein SEA_BACONJACK_62 [Mycobacterium phage BaconJack]